MEEMEDRRRRGTEGNEEEEYENENEDGNERSEESNFVMEPKKERGRGDEYF